MLNMFRTLLCSSSGARDFYVCYYRLWCAVLGLLVVGGQVQRSRLCVQEVGCCTSMPIIRSSRFLCVITAYGVQCLDCWLSGVRCREAGYASRKWDVALLCPSSGVRDFYVLLPPMVCSNWIAGCRGSGAGKQAMHPGSGMLHDGSCNIPLPGLTACFPAPDPRQPAIQALHTIGGNNT